MQGENTVPVDVQSQESTCEFCRPEQINYVLKETQHFLLAVDHAPLVEGHLLIIPKQHYACYGDVPARLDKELFALKDDVHMFLSHFYALPVYWEHGIFRQTVFHAHLHCFPWGKIGYNLEEKLHADIALSQDGIRDWYAQHGPYFYLEDASVALLFAPETDRYFRVVRNVFWREVAARGNAHALRTPQQRFEAGPPLIQAVMEKWKLFQQQGASYANESGTR